MYLAKVFDVPYHLLHSELGIAVMLTAKINSERFCAISEINPNVKNCTTLLS
ncbi:unknown protein [Microcystis aeruginosa NIES-843]|uniref:Uncharacterized protein n=1 Tax=Microcystis aeruginosa (strain NIES-843 / IAM M-2473) TaxID=449447 RepID=B0JMV0_MICAN|nr:unknown protein [Microcystis aeruginosa NIES-843]